ncbi:MAG: hypothetical protein ABEL76_17665, partial [Bradymonadaceae bacterium]
MTVFDGRTVPPGPDRSCKFDATLAAENAITIMEGVVSASGRRRAVEAALPTTGAGDVATRGSCESSRADPLGRHRPGGAHAGAPE